MNLPKQIPNVPIDCRNRFAKMLFSLLQLQPINMAVNTSRFFDGGNPASHPACATSQLVIGGKNRPIQGILQRDETIDCADCLSFQIGLCGWRIEIEIAVGVTICVAISITIQVSAINFVLGPGSRDF